MVQIDYAVLPKGSLVLVTGANGFVASHLIDQLLELGYKVRGAARSQAKVDKHQKRWDNLYPERFEFVEVADIVKPGAYDDAIKGVDDKAHVASNLTLSPNFDEVVGDAVQGTLNALRAAAKTPSVKRFVLTSSVLAVGSGENGQGEVLGEKDFNREAIGKARSLPDDALEKGSLVYAASKTLAELEAWSFVEENKPSFVLNVVNPAVCVGESLVGEAESTAGMFQGLYLSQSTTIFSLSSTFSIVHVSDIARVHIGGLLLPDIKGKRLIATPHPVNWVDVLDIFRKLDPNKEFYENPKNATKAIRSYESNPALEVLKRLGRDDWVSLENSLKDTVAAVA